MTTLSFDVQCGASGDMILSSLIDLGVPLEYLRTELSKLHIPGLSINVEKQKRSGITCTHLLLDWENREAHLGHSHGHESDHDENHGRPHGNDHSHDHGHDHQEGHHHGHGDANGHHHDHDHDHGDDHEHHHDHDQSHTHGHAHGPDFDHGNAYRHDHNSFRNARQILDIIKSGRYGQSVETRYEKILRRLSEAEAAVHGVSVDEVHFHEIGAIDTIVDVAGICLCLEYLKVDRIIFSTLTDGRGTVVTRHGIMPVPVPAVAKLCEGFSLNIVDIESELLTPTGCAVLTTLGSQVTSGFSGHIEKTGYGCGDKVFEKTPNALRVFLVKEHPPAGDPADHAWCLESDMDHISGEVMGNTAEILMKSGALDVSWSPVFMKKGRPGYRLTVVCDSDKKQALVDLVILHTRTLGVRIQRMERAVADRQAGEATFLGTPIREKQCSYKGVTFTKPEYESLAQLSEKTGRPLVELMEEYYKRHR